MSKEKIMKNTCEVEMTVDNFVKLLKDKGVISKDVTMEFNIEKKFSGSQWDPYERNEVTGIKFIKLIDVNIPDGKIL